LLAVEVADSSLVYDTGAKLALYASRGICEVWVVNLIDREVQIHRKPDGDRYETSFRAGCSDILQIEALPGVIIAAGQVFG
jgi:Uma2 family endonuclease